MKDIKMNFLPLICLLLVIIETEAEKISDLRLCADRNCESMILFLSEFVSLNPNYGSN